MSGKVFYFEPNRLPIGFEIPPHKEECGPHLCVPTLDGNAHVIPTAVIEKIVSGEMAVTDMDDWEIITRKIFSEWLQKLLEESCNE